MNSKGKHPCDQTELVALYALNALPASERPAMDAHLLVCWNCREELRALRPVVESFRAWPMDVLRPPSSIWERLAERLPKGTEHVSPPPDKPIQEGPPWADPEWEEVAPGISWQIFATDRERDRVSMLVRLAPGIDYPPHTHAGVEELYLLEGELWINDRKLYPGNYNYAGPGTSDQRVWSETGCTCVLITSPGDRLG